MRGGLGNLTTGLLQGTKGSVAAGSEAPPAQLCVRHVLLILLVPSCFPQPLILLRPYGDVHKFTFSRAHRVSGQSYSIGQFHLVAPSRFTVP